MEQYLVMFACVLMLGCAPYLVLSRYKDAFLERLSYVAMFFGAFGLLLRELEGVSVFSTWHPPASIVAIVMACALVVAFKAVRHAFNQ